MGRAEHADLRIRPCWFLLANDVQDLCFGGL
jgi:hypothetical protein